MKKLAFILTVLLVFMSAATVVSAAAKKDKTAPTVTKTNPADYATDVMVDGSIQIRFSETIKKGSNISKITLKESELKKVSYTYEIKDKFLIITPKANLKHNTVYTVTIPAGAVQDSSGNKLAKAYSFSFSTEEDPKVKRDEVKKAYKYLVELEVNMNEQLTQVQAVYYSQLLKAVGFDAQIKSITEITPSSTPKVTPKQEDTSKADTTPAAADAKLEATVSPYPTPIVTPVP